MQQGKKLQKDARAHTFSNFLLIQQVVDKEMKRNAAFGVI